MGQVALGFRSLLVRAAIFFVMASLLAWALGGTLWPRAAVVDMPGVSFAGEEWSWRLTAGGNLPDQVKWSLIRRGTASDKPVPGPEGVWFDVTELVATRQALFFGARQAPGDADWQIYHLDEAGKLHSEGALGDRLMMEVLLDEIRREAAVQGAEPTAPAETTPAGADAAP